MKQAIILSIFLLLGLSACEEPVYTPKPRGYPKVDYPAKNYQAFDASYCSFTFEYPEYAVIEQDTAFFEGKPIDPCWFDLLIPAFDARVHCSYIPIDKKNPFDELNADAFDLASKHNLKANYIDDYVIQKPNGVSGIAFNLEGAVASPFQFVLTDSTNHFVRGSLYFNTKARPDSLAPVIDFVKKEIMHMINTFAWNEGINVN